MAGSTDAPARKRAADEPHPTGDERFSLIDKALRKGRFQQDQLIEILHGAQEVFGHLPDEVLLYIARALRLPRSRVYGVATFYHLFTREPLGEFSCSVCTGTACFVKGADAIIDALRREYGVGPGETTEDGRFTLTTTRCIGACSLAPLVVIGDDVLGHLSLDEVAERVAAMLDTEPTPAEVS